MNKEELDTLSEQILKRMKVAIDRLIEKTKQEDGELVISGNEKNYSSKNPRPQA